LEEGDGYEEDESEEYDQKNLESLLMKN